MSGTEYVLSSDMETAIGNLESVTHELSITSSLRSELTWVAREIKHGSRENALVGISIVMSQVADAHTVRSLAEVYRAVTVDRMHPRKQSPESARKIGVDISSVPANAVFVVLWFCDDMSQKEEKVGDLRENFEQDVRLMGEVRAKILAYRYAYRVAAPAFGEWFRRKVVKRVLGAAVEWLSRKIN